MANKPFDWKPVYLEALRNVPVYRHACQAAGIDRATAWRAREANPDFAEAEREALEEGIDRAEQEAYRRAVVGFEEPVVHQGRLQHVYERYVDEEGAEHYRLVLDANGQPIPLTVKKHSDTLLALFLKGRRKKVYADRTEVTGPEGGPVQQAQVVIATGVPVEGDFTDLA